MEIEYFTCSDCGFEKIIKFENRCPKCVTWIDWSDWK